MSDEGCGKVFVHWWPSLTQPGLYHVSFAADGKWCAFSGGFAVVDDFGDLVRVSPRG